MKYPFLYRDANGSFERAGTSPIGLFNAWNSATSPSLAMTDTEHARARQYARAIKSRITRFGYRYRELSNGMMWPEVPR